MFLNLGLGRMGCLPGIFDAAALDLNFALGAWDDRVTHSRSSSATQIYSDGLLDVGPENLILRSTDEANASWTKTATTIGTGATGTDGVTASRRMLSSSTTPLLAQSSIAVVASRTYTYSVRLRYVDTNWFRIQYLDSTFTNGVRGWVNLNGGGAAALGTVQNFGTGTGAAHTLEDLGGGWYRYTITGVAGTATAAGPSIRPVTADVSITGVSGVSYDADGHRFQRGTHSLAVDDRRLATTSTAVYGGRITYDPVTLACLGYLNEPQRTNLLLYNSDWTNAAWTAGGGASKVGQTVTFGANYTDYIFQNVACTVGQTYTHSVWLQAPVGLAFEVSITEVGGAFPSTATPVVGTGAPQLVSVTRTITSETTMSARLVATGVAVTVTLLSPGHQLELGATATSTIPTTGASATRAADVAYVDVATWLPALSRTNCTFYAEVIAAAAAGSERILGTNNSGYSLIDINNSTSVGSWDGSNYATAGSVALVGSARKLAVAMGAGSRVVACAGSTGTAASNNLPAPTRIYIGSEGAVGNFFQGTYLGARVYYGAQSAGQIATLTT